MKHSDPVAQARIDELEAKLIASSEAEADLQIALHDMQTELEEETRWMQLFRQRSWDRDDEIKDLKHNLEYWQDLWKFTADSVMALLAAYESATGKPYPSDPERAKAFEKKWFGEEEDD
jgi:hypothetical protein